ncbi:Prolyl endopeptidase-like [Hondaea fermentalgiana]|uniref:Prolyl endopeptidase n=1 Tax=Hondaea fermentalgiana TaxID=2315210 RepID=A0A2R5FZ85_9STRA|nr:Prolyl endopeptidase-like [Hondaea fermentalgiana]|eukprot:GBG24062.1 Prolyl endopeptidase-like [Hondaea fermentalgiana]
MQVDFAYDLTLRIAAQHKVIASPQRKSTRSQSINEVPKALLRAEKQRMGNFVAATQDLAENLLRARAALEPDFDHVPIAEPAPGRQGPRDPYEVEVDQPDGVGAEWARLKVADHVVSDQAHSYAWFRDKLYFSEVIRDQVRPARVVEWPSTRVVVDDTANEDCFVDASTCKSGQFLLVSSNSKSESQVHVMHNNGTLECIRPREAGVQYFCEHAGDYFWFVSNLEDPQKNYRLWRRPTQQPDDSSWELCSCNENGWHLEELDVFDWGLLLFERNIRDGTQRLRLVDVQTGAATASFPLAEDVHMIPMAQDAYATRQRAVPVHVTSPVLPLRTFTLGPDGDTPSSTTLTADLANEDMSSRLVSEQVSVGPLGVPVTLLRRHDARADGTHPVLVKSYGAYGTNLMPQYDPAVAALVEEHGFVVAYAHIRGGAERGRSWYLAGRGTQKRNSIDDLREVVRHLQQDWTTPELTCASATSAGGTVLAALVNESPELFAAVALNVPFLDVLDAMSDPTRSLTVPEYQEWSQDTAFLTSIDPLTNVRDRNVAYPDMYISCSLVDMRISAAAVALYAQRVRDRTPAPEVIFNWTETSGHVQHDDNQDAIDEALEHSFFVRAVFS